MSQQAFDSLTNDQWTLIHCCLQQFCFPKTRGTPRTDMKSVWNSILYVLIRGCRWKELPQGSHWAHRATAHRWLKKFRKWGLFDVIFIQLLKQANFRKLIDWNQINVDGTFSPISWRRRGGRHWLQG